MAIREVSVIGGKENPEAVAGLRTPLSVTS
jgi:hypothetical protein